MNPQYSASPSADEPRTTIKLDTGGNTSPDIAGEARPKGRPTRHFCSETSTQDRQFMHKRKGTNFMRRYSHLLAGAATLALTAFSACGQTIDPSMTQFTTGGVTVTAPVFMNREIGGPNTTAVTMTSPAGTFTGLEVLTVDVVVFIRDAAGVVQDTSIFANVNAGGNSALGDGSAAITVNFSAINGMSGQLATAINTAQTFVMNGLTVSGGGPAVAAGIGIVVNGAMAGADTLLNVADETLDMVIDPDKDGPILTQVLRDTLSTPQRLILVFGEEVATNSVLVNLDFNDFESSTTSGGTFAALPGSAFAGNPTVIGTSNGVALQFPIVAGQENLAPAAGDFVRVALAGTPAQNVDLVDLAKNVATAQVPIQVATAAPPAITGAMWLDTVSTFGASPEALAVNFSLPLSAPGDVAFWNGLALDGGGTTDLAVTGVALDPNNNQRVLLNVSGGADGVAADGRGIGGADDMLFEISVDSAAMGVTPPADIFGSTFSGSPTTDITDAIAPEAIGTPFTLDSNGDGVIDAFAWSFSEPISVDMADDAGFTLTKLAGTVHPFSLFQTNLAAGIDDPTDVANGADIVLDTMDPANDVFTSAITTFARQSDDSTGANRLEVNNVLVINFDSALVDWDGDGNAGVSDTDGEATPGTFDTNFAMIDIVAADSGIKDIRNNALAADVTNGGTVDDGAAPVAARVDFLTGDNLSAGVQKPSEKDGVAGDSATNNTASVIFNEAILNGGIDATKFRFGPSAAERFTSGDFTGIFGGGSNIARFADSSAGGFDPGDTFTIAADNGVIDADSNDFPGTSAAGAPTLSVQDVSAPYVVLQQDINGATIHSAFLGGVDANGFATSLTLTFSQDIKAGTEGAVTDWSIEGVGNPDTVTLAGNLLAFTFATNLVAADNVVTVTYNGATAASLITADGGAMGMVGAMDDTFSARRVPEANVDGEFPAVMDIAGVITGPDGNLAPAGTKVFGFQAAPLAKSATFTMNGVRVTVSDSGSINAITNRLFNIETQLFLIVDNSEMFFVNDKDGVGFVDAILTVNINANNANNITFTATGVFVGTTVNASASQGTIALAWDVLRSGDGTAFSLFNDGFQHMAQPIASAAVVTGDDGAYLLHMTSPISAFNGVFNAAGWPVIVVVELPGGERFAVTSLLNGIDNLGAITFQSLNRQSDPFNSNGNLILDPNLGNMAKRGLYAGWNILANDRNSGWQATANSVVLPRGVMNVITGTTLSNTNPLDQFVYFIDHNEDGVWTSADDDSFRFDGIAVSTGALDLFTFVMNSNGVRVGNAIRSFTGGYAAGVFNTAGGGSPYRIGVFQFGPQIDDSATSVFSAITGTGSFPDNNITLGWALVTAPNGPLTDPGAFLAGNATDFLIIFNRTGHSNVDIRTFSISGGGDATEVNRGDALFLHK